jgi:NADH dehydrogenase [ubiquinone] 1 alpha subcomplex assembly factor 5
MAEDNSITRVNNPRSPALPSLLFDRQLLKKRRNKIAATYFAYSFLKTKVAQNLADRLHLIPRSFPCCIDLGGHTGQIGQVLNQGCIILTDISEEMVRQSSLPLKVVVDEEFLPFALQSADLIISAVSLQWVNDVPGMLAQIYHCLKPDGLFMASFCGGETLYELRECLTQAEWEISNGLSPRFSPFISLETAGSLLQRTGFILPVTDHYTLQIIYSDINALFADLRHMGETNALYHRPHFLPRSVLARTVELYKARFGLPDGNIPATFDIVTMTGWTASRQV